MHHALWYGPPITSSPHTHTHTRARAHTHTHMRTRTRTRTRTHTRTHTHTHTHIHFAARSSRTLSTQACSSQGSLSLSAPHRQAVLHTLLLTCACTCSTTSNTTTSSLTQLPLSTTVHASPNSLSHYSSRLRKPLLS
jgi:hypothetical protein